MRTSIIIFFIQVFLIFRLCAQFYNSGQAPTSVKWQQINTENFQIIYPFGLFDVANQTANLLEYYYSVVSADYDILPRKISILLYNQSVQSNGYVVWAPRRAEWVTTPPQESYPQQWLEQLAIHEFRHVVQISNLEHGVNRILRLIFGEASTGALSGFLPLWFLEGDAVLAETALASSGRGRMSDFDLELRAIEQDRIKRYSYDQSYLGSYKYSIPNHYKYGYQMVTFGKLKYGDKFWKHTVNQVGKKSYLFAPFYVGLHKQAGISKAQLYNQTFDSLKTLWNSSKYYQTLKNTSNTYATNNAFYTNYKYTQTIGDSIFSVRTDIDDIARFVLITDSTEEIIYTPGKYYGARVDANKKYIVWEEIIDDLRWKQRNYSVIKLFNLKENEVIWVSRKTRYFSPCISPSGGEIVCVEIDPQNNYSLVILEIPSGRTFQRIPVKEFIEISSPVWIDKETIAFIALNSDGKNIVTKRIDNSDTRILFNAGDINVDHLTAGGGKLFFSFDYEQVKNIYFLNLINGKVFRISHTKHGADFPDYNPLNNMLSYSEYTLNGYRSSIQKPDSSSWRDMDSLEAYKNPWAESLSELAFNDSLNGKVPERKYDTKSYKRISHCFNIHSWAPFYFDPDDFMELQPKIYPGFIIFSQNKLSTITSSFSYYYKNNTHYIEPKIKIESFYPVFEISSQWANKPGAYQLPDSIDHPAEMQPFFSFLINTYFPLDFSRSKYSRLLRPEVSYRYLNVYNYSNGGFHLGSDLLGIRLYGYNLLKQSYRDIQPRFGQTVYFSLYYPVKAHDMFSKVQAIGLNQYLPGLLRHHSIRINLGYEIFEKGKEHLLNNQISLPRGYNSDFIYFENLRGSFEYSFPFLYPDWSIGPFTYIKRFHATVFVDGARVLYPQNSNTKTFNVHESLLSTGIILSSEMHFLRFFMPFTPNLRIAFLPAQQKVDLGFDISINTSGFY